MRFGSLFLFFILAAAAQDVSRTLPSADDVVAKMMELENQRLSAFRGYTSGRRYVLENSRHRKRAEMVVKVECLDNGSKQFETVSTSGWGAARSHVFPRLLESEREASSPGLHERSRITPANYSFALAGREAINQRPAYVIEIAPKTQNKYLIQGRIWVDAEEYAIVRIEGKPAKNPSFWIKSVRFVHAYQKTGPFWLPVSDRSVTDARFIGSTELTIEYFDYTTKATPATLSASRDLASGSLP